MATRNGALRGLLLDLDGTIADTHELIYRCYDEIMREQAGVAYPREAWARQCGLPLSETFRVALAEQGIEVDSVEPFVESYRARLRSYESEVKPFPGVVEALTELRARGVKLGIVTTKHASTTARHLATMKIADLFDTIVAGDQCARYKPDPEPFLRGLEGIGLEAGEAAGVGDSRFDIEGSRAAGLMAVGATWGTTSVDALLAAGPDRMLDRPEQLLSLAGV